ncbi:unnamed protein product, partial [Heligmosomoides polygyrus]|uniref:GMP_synt_C domain-containing protein n=1 Tax=Heligmosomoides polygyrus TaxID=6339 RepID=A0A183FX03_HELPZ
KFSASYKNELVVINQVALHHEDPYCVRIKDDIYENLRFTSRNIVNFNFAHPCRRRRLKSGAENAHQCDRLACVWQSVCSRSHQRLLMIFQNVMEMVRRISTLVKGTSRVMIDLTNKPPGTTEWE